MKPFRALLSPQISPNLPLLLILVGNHRTSVKVIQATLKADFVDIEGRVQVVDKVRPRALVNITNIGISLGNPPVQRWVSPNPIPVSGLMDDNGMDWLCQTLVCQSTHLGPAAVEKQVEADPEAVAVEQDSVELRVDRMAANGTCIGRCGSVYSCGG